MLPSVSTSHIVGERVCKLLGAGPALPIPGIRAAAHAALATIEFAQTVKKNKEDLIAIGKLCCCITAHVIEKAQSPSGNSNSVILQQEAKLLQKEIKFILKCVRIPWWKRLFNQYGNESTIQQCRDRLQNALELFGLRSDVELCGLVAAPSNQAKEVPKPPQIVPSFSSLPTLNKPDLPKCSQHLQSPQLLLPSSMMYNHVQGSVSNTITDGSCNVSGDHNNISFSSAP